MDIYHIVVGVHLLGFALGLGGATISDITFFKALKNRYLSRERFEFLETLSKVIWVGLGLLISSGAAIFYLIYSSQGSIPALALPRIQMKLTLVGVVLINGLFFKFNIFPEFKELMDIPWSIDNVGKIAGRLSFSGTVSILSWYSILILTQLPNTLPLELSYVSLVAIYLPLLIIGIFLSRATIRHILKTA